MTIPFLCTFDLLSTGGGKESPRDWDHSGIGLDRYASMVLRYGCVPTIFVTGEAARAHAPMIEELQDRGAEIGLLVAPHQSSNSKKSGHMGVISEQQQADAVTDAMQRFQHALGFRPTVVRTGLYSGNPSTYAVLAQAHFTHVALRMPGAALPVIGTVWEPEPSIRMQGGLVDVPVTTAPEEKLFNRFPLYFAAEISTAETHYRLMQRGKMNGLVCLTGATNADYWDAKGTSLQALENILIAVTKDAELMPLRVSAVKGP